MYVWVGWFQTSRTVPTGRLALFTLAVVGAGAGAAVAVTARTALHRPKPGTGQMPCRPPERSSRLSEQK